MVFVVSMGGSTALFLGASILSFVELFYYFFVRPVSNSITNKQKMKEIEKFRRFKVRGQLKLPSIS